MEKRVRCGESANAHIISSQFQFYRIQIGFAVVEDVCKYLVFN